VLTGVLIDGDSDSRSRTGADQSTITPQCTPALRSRKIRAPRDHQENDEATDGYITRSELREMVCALHVGAGQKIADLGCGRGGPGQWIAGVTGAALVGIDFSAVALEQARARARRLGIASSYQSGSFDATGLDPASVDGALSIDVIWAIPDKQAGFDETARILRPGASSSSLTGNVTSPHLAILLRLATIDRYSRRRGSRLNGDNFGPTRTPCAVRFTRKCLSGREN
jgi:SAM-dependent methyltransferase